MNLRWIVLKTLDAIEFEGLYVHDAIDRMTDGQELSKQDRGFIKKVVFGTIENQIYLDYVINQFSKIKVKKMKPAVRLTLRLSVYQLLFMENIPESAVCNEAVKLIKKRKMNSLTGFTNGVLRQIVREKENISLPDQKTDYIKYLSVKYSFDEKMIEKLAETYDKSTLEEFLKVSMEEAPLSIRVQTMNTTKESLMEQLQSEDIEVENGHFLNEALHISGVDRLELLESFQKGLFQVQDESSMMVGDVGFEQGMNVVIDVCSAPGGKATHVADLLKGKGQVLAFDVTEKKLERIKENYLRLGQKNLKVAVGDATTLNAELIEQGDLVIADVPCSGLGIIRKKPDIKWHMSVEQIATLTELQRSILNNVKKYVKEGGVLVYSTCTITQDENMDNVTWFLENNPEFYLEHIQRPYANQQSGMVQLLPISNGPDGFFIAKMRRKKTNE